MSSLSDDAAAPDAGGQASGVGSGAGVNSRPGRSMTMLRRELRSPDVAPVLEDVDDGTLTRWDGVADDLAGTQRPSARQRRVDVGVAFLTGEAVDVELVTRRERKAAHVISEPRGFPRAEVVAGHVEAVEVGLDEPKSVTSTACGVQVSVTVTARPQLRSSAAGPGPRCCRTCASSWASRRRPEPECG